MPLSRRILRVPCLGLIRVVHMLLHSPFTILTVRGDLDLYRLGRSESFFRHYLSDVERTRTGYVVMGRVVGEAEGGNAQFPLDA